MYRPLENVIIKTGERIEIGVVVAPDPEWKESLLSLLGHKGHPWTYHVERALDGAIAELETRFYVAILDGRVVANICLFEDDRVGIFAHVYTQPQYRQRGIARQVQRVVMEDFRLRGGRVLTLSTEFNSHPFHLYASFGFKPIIPGVGNMTCEMEEGFQERIYTPGSRVTARDQTWGDWPHLNLLYHQPRGDWFRSVRHRLYRPQSYEGPFLEERVELERGFLSAKTLVTDEGTVVGNLVCGPDPRWAGAVDLLDLHVHENYAEHASRLLETVPERTTKIISYARQGTGKEQALRRAGYAEEGRLKGVLRGESGPYDVLILARNPR